MINISIDVASFFFGMVAGGVLAMIIMWFVQHGGRNMNIERYRLILTHEYIDDDGKAYKIEDPICTDYSIMMDEFAPPRSVVVNEMIERLKHFMLSRVE